MRLLTRMVDDLLDIARITRGSFQLRKELVRPADLIARAVDTVRHLAEERGQCLEVATAPELPHLEVDPARLEQVICNLLTNAFKFTPQGGRIEVSAVADGNELVLTVRDSGIGIARDFLPQVFEPFAQADKSLGRGRGGLGIGLTLVKTIVELHGGSVEARSEGPNQGCEMIVRLPTVGAVGAIVPGPASPDDRPILGGDREPPPCESWWSMITCNMPKASVGCWSPPGTSSTSAPMGSRPCRGAGVRSRCDPPRSRAARDGWLRGRTADAGRPIARPCGDRRDLGIRIRRRPSALQGGRRR